MRLFDTFFRSLAAARIGFLCGVAKKVSRIVPIRTEIYFINLFFLPKGKELSVSNETTGRLQKRGLIIDFDYVVLNGIEIVANAWVEALKHIGMENVSGSTFARYLFGKRAAEGLRGMNGIGDRIPKAQATAAAAITDGFHAAEPSGPALEAAKLAIEDGDSVVFLTAHGADFAEEVLRKAGIENPVVVEDESSSICEYSSETWTKAIVKTGVPERLCTACVATAASARTVLLKDVRVIAFPHRIVSFQDYSGVQMRADAATPVEEITSFLNS